MTSGTELLWTIKDQEGIEGRTLDASRIEHLERMLHSLYGNEIIVQSLERLRSRKNVVLHLVLRGGTETIDVVSKLFIEESFEIETEVLTLGTKVPLSVPSIVAADDGVLLMKFIDGIPLVDVVNETFDETLVEMLAEWYHDFHHRTGHIKGDPRLRNFILSSGQIYGFDFEEYRCDHWMQDIGGISASILDTRPVFDKRKVELVWHLLETYLALSNQERDKSIDVQFTEVIANTLEQTAKWRDDAEILAHARRVRQYGLLLE